LSDDLDLKVERVIDAPRDAVWRCWIEAELLKQWYCPKPWRVTEADIKLVPGGRFNCVFQGPKPEERHDLTGCYLEVVPGERLVFTDGFSEGFVPRPKHFMTGYVDLSDEANGKTRMVWGARHATAEDRQAHLDMGFEQGWGAAADQLEELARSLAKARVQET
jgi:uncharacterized protein YndB with AHSA1/START domain